MENSSRSTGCSPSTACHSCSLRFPNCGKGGREGPQWDPAAPPLTCWKPPACPGGSLDVKNPFRWCVKVLLGITEMCERRGCCCPKRSQHPKPTPSPQPGEKMWESRTTLWLPWMVGDPGRGLRSLAQCPKPLCL